MYLKIHENAEGRVVAVCDKELIGKVLEEGDKYIDLDRYRAFYMGEIAGENRVKESLGDFRSANLVGQKAIKTVLDMGLIEKGDVMYINEIPYAQIYKI